ncbi:MAG: adenylyl-sulfate kinase [Cycloclasticus sp.]
MIKNLTWHQPQVLGFDRIKDKEFRPVTLWLTGLSGAGKSTIAQRISRLLYQRNINEFVLDGDNMRHGLCTDLGFSPMDRQENVRRISETAKILNEAGVSAICPVISPYEKDRSMASHIIGKDRFIEIYCNCDIETCERRDVKGLYKMARLGKIQDFTGINAPYEEPASPEIHIDTSILSVTESANEIIRYLFDFEKTHSTPVTIKSPCLD